MDNIVARFTKNKWFVLVVIVPSLLVTFYEGLIASDQYVSESRFVIKAPSQKSASITSIANIFQTTGLSGGQEQSGEVMDYVRSRTGLADLSRLGSVEKVYSRPGIDVISRYPAPFVSHTKESLFRYYNKKVSTELDHDTGLVVLRVIAFEPQDAYTLNSRLLDLSEQLVNRLNIRSRSREIAEAQNRVADAQERVRNARVALAAFRNEQALLDPGKQATGVLEIANRLVSERAALQAQLEQTQSAAPANPAIPALRARISAISREIDAQNGRATGTSNGIASKMTGYEARAAEAEFANQNLTAANAALVSAQTESARQAYYLERVVNPNIPDLGEYPRRLRIILTTIAALLCVYFIGWMFVTGILEHAPED